MKKIIRRYPTRLAKYKEMHYPSMSFTLTGLPSAKNNISDPTSCTALRELSPIQQKEFEAVHKAVEKTIRTPNGKDKIKLIELVYWRQSHTLMGAAMQIPCADVTAWRWHGEFIREVAKNFGLMDEDDSIGPCQ